MPSRLGDQRVCSECGVLFLARGDALTDSPKCRVRRCRRVAKGLPEPYGPERRHEIMAGVRATAEEGAVAMAQDIMAEELRPVVREALTPAVLRAIADMVSLAPLMVAALKEELVGAPLRDPETGLPLRGSDGLPILAVDPDRRLKAVALLSKYTVGAPGLAPQADTKQTPIAINFGSVPRPDYDGTAERICEVCEEPRAEDDFVGGSNRCSSCQETLETAAHELAAP